jgi:hypothetical protein
MKHSHGQIMKDDFIALARKAFRRVARQLRAENARLGLPLIFGKNGRVHLVRARKDFEFPSSDAHPPR